MIVFFSYLKPMVLHKSTIITYYIFSKVKFIWCLQSISFSLKKMVLEILRQIKILIEPPHQTQ